MCYFVQIEIVCHQKGFQSIIANSGSFSRCRILSRFQISMAILFSLKLNPFFGDNFKTLLEKIASSENWEYGRFWECCFFSLIIFIRMHKSILTSSVCIGQCLYYSSNYYYLKTEAFYLITLHSSLTVEFMTILKNEFIGEKTTFKCCISFVG